MSVLACLRGCVFECLRVGVFGVFVRVCVCWRGKVLVCWCVDVFLGVGVLVCVVCWCV